MLPSAKFCPFKNRKTGKLSAEGIRAWFRIIKEEGTRPVLGEAIEIMRKITSLKNLRKSIKNNGDRHQIIPNKNSSSFPKICHCKCIFLQFSQARVPKPLWPQNKSYNSCKNILNSTCSNNTHLIALIALFHSALCCKNHKAIIPIVWINCWLTWTIFLSRSTGTIRKRPIFTTILLNWKVLWINWLLLRRIKLNRFSLRILSINSKICHLRSIPMLIISQLLLLLHRLTHHWLYLVNLQVLPQLSSLVKKQLHH